jgi:hypothetical protein
MVKSSLYAYENKFELITNGGATVTEIKEPIDWAGQDTILTRDPKWHGVNFEFTEAELPLGFDCAAGRSILKNLYDTYGNDATGFLRFSSKINGVWQAMPDMKLDFNFYEDDLTVIRLTLKRTSFEDLFRTRFSIKHDINSSVDLDGNLITPLAPIDLEMHSKGLYLQTDREFSELNEEFGTPPLRASGLLELRYEDDPIKSNLNGGALIQHREQTFYAQPTFDKINLDDIETNQNVPFGISLTGPNPQYLLKEPGVLTVEFGLVFNADLYMAGQWRGSRADLRIDGCSRGAASMGYSKIDLVLQIGDEKIVVKSYENTNPTCDLKINQTGYYFQATSDLGLFSNELVTDFVDPINVPLGDFYGHVKFDSLAIEVFEPLLASAPVTFEYETISATRPVDTGDEVAIYLEIYGEGDYVRQGLLDSDVGWFPQAAFYNEDLSPTPNTSFLKMSLNSVEEITNSEAYLIHETVEKSIEITTGLSGRLRSDLLGRTSIGYGQDGCAAFNTLLNGFSIRNFDVNNRPPNTSLEEELNSIRAIYNIGAGLSVDSGDDVLIVEQAEHFYQNVVIRTVDEAYDYRLEVDSEHIYNEIEIGYESFQEDGINLLDEPNTRRRFITPIRSEKRKIDIISPYISSGYTIELQRRDQFSKSPSESLDYDDKMFIVAVLLDGPQWKSERDEDFSIVNNVFSPSTAYNLKLTPKRMLYRWANFLKSSLKYKNQATDKVRFTFGFKNNDLETQTTSLCEQQGLIKESDDVLLDDFPDNSPGLFSPEKIMFKEKLSWPDYEEMRKALKGESVLPINFGYISVKNPNGVYEGGFPMEIRYNISSQEASYILRKKWL